MPFRRAATLSFSSFIHSAGSTNGGAALGSLAGRGAALPPCAAGAPRSKQARRSFSDLMARHGSPAADIGEAKGTLSPNATMPARSSRPALRGARAAPGATPFSAPANRERCIKFFQMAVRSGIERAMTVRANGANSHLFIYSLGGPSVPPSSQPPNTACRSYGRMPLISLASVPPNARSSSLRKARRNRGRVRRRGRAHRAPRLERPRATLEFGVAGARVLRRAGSTGASGAWLFPRPLISEGPQTSKTPGPPRRGRIWRVFLVYQRLSGQPQWVRHRPPREKRLFPSHFRAWPAPCAIRAGTGGTIGSLGQGPSAPIERRAWRATF